MTKTVGLSGNSDQRRHAFRSLRRRFGDVQRLHNPKAACGNTRVQINATEGIKA